MPVPDNRMVSTRPPSLKLVQIIVYVQTVNLFITMTCGAHRRDGIATLAICLRNRPLDLYGVLDRCTPEKGLLCGIQ